MPVYTKKNSLVYCVYYLNGKRVWESFGRGKNAHKNATTRDLEIKLNKKKGLLSTGRYGFSLTYLELVQLYINAKKTELSDNTMDGILRAINVYARPVIGTKPVNRITMNDWWDIQDLMTKRGISNRTINIYFVYLSGILSWSIDENEDLLDDHPWRKRRRLKATKYRVRLFSLDEFKAILNAAEHHCAWALEVAYYTGVRPGPTELFNLQWKDVEWQYNRIAIHSTKSHASTFRWQYPDMEFMNKLKSKYEASQKEYPECPWICAYKGAHVTTIKRSWRHAKEKAGITRRIRLYDIRHFYITYALASGADIMELAERVGHINSKMIVDVYAHLAKDLQKNKPLAIPSLY